MFEAYEVAVRISVVNHVSSALMSMSQQFSKLHGQATDFQRKLESIKLTMLKGGALLGAGAFGLKMFDGAIKSADHITTSLRCSRTSACRRWRWPKA